MITQNFQQGTMRLNIHPLKAVNYAVNYITFFYDKASASQSYSNFGITQYLSKSSDQVPTKSDT